MCKTRIAFVFGAGAEGKHNYDIVTGLDYLKASLYGEGIGHYHDALAKYFNGEYYGKKYTYQRHQIKPTIFLLRNMIIEKIRNTNIEWDDVKDDIALILTREEIEELRDEFEQEKSEKEIKKGYLDQTVSKDKQNTEYKHTLMDSILSIETDIKKKNRDNGEDRTGKIVEEFEKILKDSKGYDDVQNGILKKLFTPKDKDNIKDKDKGNVKYKRKCDYDIRIGLGGYMDSYFHTIINPPRFSNIRFSKIFNYYWACYFVVLRDIMKLYGDPYKEYYDKELDCEKILNNHKELSVQLYNDYAIPERKTYYTAINDCLQDSRNNIELAGVLTTNYFNFAEKVLELRSDERIAYLNGQLKWMERPEYLEVRDITEESPIDGLYFPFIFGQSMTKPIVHNKQIEEFSKAKSILEKADYLIVIGYGINEDDNHVNSMLHEYVIHGGKIVVLNFQSPESDRQVKQGTAAKIKCEEKDILCCNVSKYSTKDQEKIIQTIINYIKSRE